MSKPKKLYFVSDIHIGGEGILNKFEAKKEFILFLHFLELESKTHDLELIIAGDFLNLWDIQRKKGLEKFYYLKNTHSSIFKKIKEATKKIKITLIPGNHDHDLACFEEYKKELSDLGITFINQPHLKRKFYNKKILVEHGNRFDPSNKIKKFGDWNDTPAGYHLKKNLILNIVKYAEKNNKKRTWLADLPYFNYPYKIGPLWLISNYFYRELAPILRYLITPFLMLFFISLFILILAVTTYFNLINLPNIFHLTSHLGPARVIANIIIIYNLVFLIIFILFYFIWQVMRRDLIKNLKEYGIDIKQKLGKITTNIWYSKSRRFLNKHKNVDIFIFGHSHYSFINKSRVKNKTKIIANPGSWIKTFLPIKSRFFLPRVFIPYFKLGYITLERKNKNYELSLKYWPKKAIYDLTAIQKISIFGKKREVNKKEKKVIINQ